MMPLIGDTPLRSAEEIFNARFLGAVKPVPQRFVTLAPPPARPEPVPMHGPPATRPRTAVEEALRGGEARHHPDRQTVELTETALRGIHEALRAAQFELASRQGEIDRLKRAKDTAYGERNKLLVFVARLCRALGFRVGMGFDNDQGGDADFRNVLYIDLPTGQVSWHIPEWELPLFKELPQYGGEWDGHDSHTKWHRLLRTVITPGYYISLLTQQPIDFDKRLLWDVRK